MDNESAGRLTLTGCTISGNTAEQNGYGGGLFNAGTANLADCTISGNSAAGSGFGARGGGLDNGAGTLSLTGCTISGNSAYVAGGLQNDFPGDGEPDRLHHRRQQRPLYGGGLNSLATLNLTGCTISGNSARPGGGGASLYGTREPDQLHDHRQLFPGGRRP